MPESRRVNDFCSVIVYKLYFMTLMAVFFWQIWAVFKQINKFVERSFVKYLIELRD